MFMRRIDRLISGAMWLTIAMSVPVMAMLAQDRAFRSDWPYTIALCLVWVPPALSLAYVNDMPGPQSPWFYRFAILTLVWAVALAAYGIFVFDPNP
jgi:hypothetical protein